MFAYFWLIVEEKQCFLQYIFYLRNFRNGVGFPNVYKNVFAGGEVRSL